MHHRLARIYLDEKNDYEAATREFENVLSLPQNAQLIYKQFAVAFANLGHAYYETGSRLAENARRAVLPIVQVGDHEFPHVGSARADRAGGSSAVPKDTDGDQIPDYVEDANGNGVYDPGTETDWQNATTDGTNPDKWNALYDDVDLDGDLYLSGHLSMVEDPHGVLRLYHRGPDDTLAVMTSKDGIHWDTPAQNIVLRKPVALGNVFIDPNAPPESRWKYVSGIHNARPRNSCSTASVNRNTASLASRSGNNSSTNSATCPSATARG